MRSRNSCTVLCVCVYHHRLFLYCGWPKTLLFIYNACSIFLSYIAGDGQRGGYLCLCVARSARCTITNRRGSPFVNFIFLLLSGSPRYFLIIPLVFAAIISRAPPSHYHWTAARSSWPVENKKKKPVRIGEKSNLSTTHREIRSSVSLGKCEIRVTNSHESAAYARTCQSHVARRSLYNNWNKTCLGVAICVYVPWNTL